jgi:ferric-dicitrate binding protein FerR (iron transport regulator)
VEPVWNDMDELIGKVLAGEASAAEHDELARWRSENEKNENYFQQIKRIFEKASSVNVALEFDTDTAWNTVRQKINKNDAKVISLNNSTPFFTPWRIAAGIIFLIGSVFVYNYYIRASDYQLMGITAQSTTLQDTLPDGSMAFLNKKTELDFEFNPSTKTRKVRLRGEAFFNVKHEEEKPFIIEAGDVLVRDIGTQFNLKAYPDKDTIEIVVTEGEVQFYTESDSGLNLKAGDKAAYSKKSKQFFRIDKPDTNVLAYKTKVFSFNNTDLRSVVALLNDVYNSKIVLASDKIYECRLTANFKEDDALIIVEVIAETMGLELTIKNDEFILNGSGCEK